LRATRSGPLCADHERVGLGQAEQRGLVVLVDGRLLGSDEARAHLNPTAPNTAHADRAVSKAPAASRQTGASTTCGTSTSVPTSSGLLNDAPSLPSATMPLQPASFAFSASRTLGTTW
jgi:hypothetical protein